MWHPGHTTTFVLPVFEIEQIIVQLQISLLNTTISLGASVNVSSQIQQQIKNWQTVLSNYRLHNAELTPMFSVENIMFLNMTKSFNLWNKGIISDADLVGVIDGGIDDDAVSESNPRNIARFSRSFSQSFRTISDSCSSLVPQYQSPYMRTICADFDSTHWSGFSSLVDGACSMPNTPYDGINTGPELKPNPLSNSQLVQTLCLHRVAAQSKDIPGGLSPDGTDDSLMGFMTRKEKYLTFGAKAPIQISWTSSVSDSKTFRSNLALSGGRSSSKSGSIGGSFYAASFDTSQDSGTDMSHSISIGKTSSSNHNFKRSVAISFSDNDYGCFNTNSPIVKIIILFKNLPQVTILRFVLLKIQYMELPYSPLWVDSPCVPVRLAL